MTIKDIARLAGCGVSTVSRALNGSNEISEQTKERINEVIRKYNYTPNGNARRMRRSAEKTILLIVNGSSNLFFSPLIEQIQIAASSAGFQIAVNHIDELLEYTRIHLNDVRSVQFYTRNQDVRAFPPLRSPSCSGPGTISRIFRPI